MMGVHTEPSAPQKELIAKAEELRKSGAHTSVTDARAALQKMRSVTLGAAAGMSGVAEYKVLLGAEGILRVEQAGTKTITGGQERLKKAKLTGFMPSHSAAQLVLVGMLNCHSDTCEFVLEP